MGYGLRIVNDSGELTVSSDAKIPYCIGRANYEQTIQADGEIGALYPGRQSGWSRYRAWTNGPVVFAVVIPVGWYVRVLNATQVATNVWDVYISAGWQKDPNGFIIENQVEVYAYGFAPSVAESYGLALYDKNGNLTADMTRPNLMFPRAMINAPTIGFRYTMPSFWRTLIMGSPNSTGTQTRSLGGKFGEEMFDVTHTAGYWYRASDTTISVERLNTERYIDYGVYGMVNVDGLNLGFILDGSNL